MCLLYFSIWHKLICPESVCTIDAGNYYVQETGIYTLLHLLFD